MLANRIACGALHISYTENGFSYKLLCARYLLLQAWGDDGLVLANRRSYFSSRMSTVVKGPDGTLHDRLQAGWGRVSFGPVVHAGAGTMEDEPRIMLFFTGHVKDFKPYNPDFQLTSWVYVLNFMPGDMRTRLDLAVDMVIDYKDCKPFSYFGATPVRSPTRF